MATNLVKRRGMNMNEILKKRYENLIEQIDFYSWIKNDKGFLSNEQRIHLSELKNAIHVFGERSEKWVELANKLLNQ